MMTYEDDQLQTTSSASLPGLKSQRSTSTYVLPGGSENVSISAKTYARLLSLADQAPLECLPLTSRTLACAKTLGYNQIGQIRSTPRNRLLADLGADRAEELKRALFDFGMRQPGATDTAD